jgi:hypothetical protein
MHRNNLPKVFLSILLMCVAAVAAFAQGTTSRVTGTALDPSGAAVPGAAVTLTNEATQATLNTQTSDSGTYVFDLIQVGTYTVTVEKQGFKKQVTTGIKVDINQPATVNAKMEVGGLAEVVQVVGGAEQVQTSSSGNFGNTVEQQTLETLPIVNARGRNPLDFINFQPGVVPNANTGGGIHVHGARDRAFNFTLDGIDINESSAGGSNFTPLRPNPDSLTEFQVVTSNFTAELGRSSGAQVTLVTRSGGNEFHGRLFEFYQTPGLQANAFINNFTFLTLNSGFQPVPKPKFVQHIFGGNFEGPIIKNKTFFFTNLQLLRTSETRLFTRTVYTALARQGIFRYVRNGRNNPIGSSNGPAAVDAQGNPVAGLTINTYNVPTNDPLGLGLDPTTQKLIGLTPLPNNFTVGDGLNTAGFSFLAPSREKQYDFVTKIDHTFNDRNTIYVRYAQGAQNTFGDYGNTGAQSFPGLPNLVDTFRTPKNLAVNYRTSLSPTLTNELIVGFNRFGFSFNNPDPNVAQNAPFILNNVTDPLNATPAINNLRRITTYQLVDNVSWIRGPHTFRTGINFRYQKHADIRSSVAALSTALLADFSRTTNPPDATQFKITAAQLPGLNANDRNTLLSQINDLLGRVGSVTQAFVAADDSTFAPPGTLFTYDARYGEYDSFFQDTWKFRPNLTLDLGLRWEVKMSPRGGGGDRVLVPDRPIRLGATPSDSIKFVEGRLFDDDWNNFAPAVGFAWDPFKSGKTSIRGNFRLAYDRMNTFITSSQIFPNMPGVTTGVTNTTFGTSGGRVRNGLPVLTPTVTPSALSQPPVFSTNSLTVFDPSTRTPKTYQWGFSLQRELGFNTVLEANYIGRKGIGLYGAYDVNQVDIFNNGFLAAFNTVRAGGESDLINSLLEKDTARIAAGVSGSVFLRNTLASTAVTQGSVAAAANTIATRRNSGQAVPVFVQNGFSPFFFRPFPQFSGTPGIRVLDSNDFSVYNALELELKRRFTNGFSFQASYTLAKSLDTRSFDPTFSVVSTANVQSASSTPFDNRNRRLNYARSDFDRRHSLQGYVVSELPFGHGRRFLKDAGPIVDRLIGGWEMAGIMIWESGRPFTVYSGINTLSNVVQTPASCNDCSATMGNFVVENGRTFWFTADQRAKFTAPAPGEFGNVGRNFFNTPATFRMDFTIGKKFRITERANFEVRAEMQNVTNHVNQDNPTATITSSTFGRVDDSGVLFPARRIQLAAKFNF